MTDWRNPSGWREVARELARMQDQLNASRSSQLAHSSIEDGALDEYDADGTLVASFGRQFDGSHIAATFIGPIPPTPSAPLVEAGLESLTVTWDGIFLNEDGAPDETVTAPMDFSRVEVHVSTDPEFTAEFADTLRGSIESPRGGKVVVTLLTVATTYYVRLVARSAPGKPSPASTAATGTPNDPGLIVLKEINAAETVITNAADMLIGAADPDGDTVGKAINDAATSPVTDERLAEGTLTVWPFQGEAVPPGALAPGAVGEGDIADFAVAVKKLNTNRHMIY